MSRLRTLAIAAAAAAATMLTAGAASAQSNPIPGYTTPPLNLRPGPGTQYNPPILVMPANSFVWIYYCVPQPYWCLVGYNNVQGWASGSYLTAYPNQYIPPNVYPYQPTPPPPPPVQQPGYWTYPGGNSYEIIPFLF